ncbi:MAG TPA: thioredoxin family protein [Myxococcota bacterium]|nr:thioredoxin family protein [Myxococcota bacterium]HQK51690.1 thioredoxin family protein [Myxococcota bacterium]
MLQTNLKHVETVQDYRDLTQQGKTVIVCGRMGPMCIPVYGVMESLESKYPDIRFRDMEFDSPVAMQTIRALPEVRNFHGLPFTVYFRDGKVVAATSSIQTKAQVKEILDSRMADGTEAQAG